MSRADDASARIGHLAQQAGLKVAVAESLTSGSVAAHLGAAENASDWFVGGVVAYDIAVKHSILGVDEGPIVTEECARQMAEGTAELLGADAVVALTGVGGPDPDEGKRPGTVCLATTVRGHTTTHTMLVEEDDPPSVIKESVDRSLEALAEAMVAGSSPTT